MAELIRHRNRRIYIEFRHVNQQMMMPGASLFDARRCHAHAAQSELYQHRRGDGFTVFQIDEIQ